MIKLKSLLLESISPENLVEYYEKRAEEIKREKGHSNYSTGTFQFEYYQNRLSIMCDVIHIDTILNSVDPEFDINTFRLSDYVPKVIDALREVNVLANTGMVSSGPFIILGKRSPGQVSVSTYTGDTITVQMDIDNIERLLKENPHLVTKTIDVFIVKMFETMKVLETDIFPPYKI